MAEYYRILSYLYRYDKKNKMDCKGFIKAEQKKNELKITLQIDDERLPEDIKLALCFYGKGKASWTLWQLALLESSRHHEETVLFYPAKTLPEGFDIRKQYGVILLYQESLFYGSVWIGDEIPVEALMTIYQEKLALSVSDGKDRENEQKREGRREEGQETADLRENEQETMERQNSGENHAPETERKEAAVQGVEISERPVVEKKLSDDRENGAESDASEENQTVREEERLERKLSTEPEDTLHHMWIDTGKKAKPVDNIFNPAFRSGYQISVDQLKALSPEAWGLSDNQFLAKGYAMYHHLLAGKVIYAGEERYCVGVPGIYENRERYMAQLYQFPIFLSLTENRIKTGGFGYWLHLLQE